jgi:hypothetical protein
MNQKARVIQMQTNSEVRNKAIAKRNRPKRKRKKKRKRESQAVKTKDKTNQRKKNDMHHYNHQR